MSKTYLEMGDTEKAVISALYFVRGWGPKKISEYIDWPWQSVNAHIKVLEDRIKMGSASEDELIAKGREFLKGVEIHEAQPEVTDEPVAPIVGNASLVASITQKELYIAMLESLMQRIVDGVIIPQGMSVSDVDGEFYLQFGKAV